MIPCLYSQGETQFQSNGIGKLCDAVSCVVIEKRNGSYELKMAYPMDGLHADKLIEDNLILAKPSEQGDPQAFRIYHVSTPLNGLLEINARHISYQQNHITVSPFSAGSAQAALAGLRTNAASACPFTFETDIESNKQFTVSVPATIRSCLGSMDDSILDTYGGEFEWDMYRTILHAHRGTDLGVKILYGKNLIDFQMERSIDSLMTGVHPYWYKQNTETGEETLIELPEKTITINIGQTFERIEPLNCSSVFTSEPTLEQIRDYARWYLQDEKFSRPNADITVNFAQLWQLPGYADIVEAERVSLCDTVHVYISRLNLVISYKVTETEYNVLLDRYNSIVLSNETVRSKNKRSYFVGTIADLQAQAEATEATAQRTSTEIRQVSCTLRDEVNGLTSTITQTASQIRSEVSDSVNGLSSTITQTASQIRSEVSDSVNGLNSSITQTASQIRSEVSDSVNGLNSSITQTASQIRAEVSDSVNGLNSSITQTASQIRSEVSDSVNGLNSSITQTASQIRSEVRDSVNGLGSSITQTASQIRSEMSDSVNNLNSRITQTASQIRSEVTDKVNSVRSSITQEASQIRQEITSATAAASIVAKINNAGSSVIISADHIELDGEAVADSLSGEGFTCESINVDSLDVYAIYGYQWYITDADGHYLNKKLTDAISSITENTNAPSGKIGISYTKLNGSTGTVNFRIADTQTYKDGVSAAWTDASNTVDLQGRKNGSGSFVSIKGQSYASGIALSYDDYYEVKTVYKTGPNNPYSSITRKITAPADRYSEGHSDGYTDGWDDCVGTIDLKWYDSSNGYWYSLTNANYAFTIASGSSVSVAACYTDSSGYTHRLSRSIAGGAPSSSQIDLANASEINVYSYDPGDGYTRLGQLGVSVSQCNNGSWVTFRATCNGGNDYKYYKIHVDRPR